MTILHDNTTRQYCMTMIDDNSSVWYDSEHNNDMSMAEQWMTHMSSFMTAPTDRCVR